MNKRKREQARRLLDKGMGVNKIAQRLEVKRDEVIKWRRELLKCLRCDIDLEKPTGICGFCLDEEQLEKEAA